jgi:hypothetical protein
MTDTFRSRSGFCLAIRKKEFFSCLPLKPAENIAAKAIEIDLCGATHVQVLLLNQPDISNAELREMFGGAGRRMRAFSAHLVQ